MNPVETHDLAAADATLKAAQAPWAASLTAGQAEALDGYKGTDGRTMNEVLRGEIVSGRAAVMVGELRAALETAKAQADMRLWRGVGPREADVYRVLQPGNVTAAAAFFWTTLDRLEAERAACDQKGGVLIEVWVRKGVSGVAYVHPFPRYRYPQYEVLANVGSRLRILCAAYAVIRLEIIDDDTDE